MANKVTTNVKAGIGRLMKVLGWVIPIVALIVAVVYLIKGQPNPTYTEKPEALMPEYMRTILPYLPPSPQLPTQENFTKLLSFFSEKEQDWARKQMNALAWLGMSQNDVQYREADDQKKMQAAFKFIVMQGPTQPVSIHKTVYTDDKKHVTLSAASVRAKYELGLALEGGQWRIEDMWGIPSKYATQISQFKSKFGEK